MDKINDYTYNNYGCLMKSNDSPVKIPTTILKSHILSFDYEIDVQTIHSSIVAGKYSRNFSATVVVSRE